MKNKFPHVAFFLFGVGQPPFVAVSKKNPWETAHFVGLLKKTHPNIVVWVCLLFVSDFLALLLCRLPKKPDERL